MSKKKRKFNSNENHKKATIESYDKTVADYIANTDKLHPTREAREFLSLLPKGALILDLGCGPGRDAKVFAGKGFRVVGVDLSKNMIRAARKRVKNALFRLGFLLKG